MLHRLKLDVGGFNEESLGCLTLDCGPRTQRAHVASIAARLEGVPNKMRGIASLFTIQPYQIY